MIPANDGCVWLVRDLAGWRHGIVATASADLLVAWRPIDENPRAAAAVRALRPVVEQIRQARLAADLTRVEQACSRLTERAQRTGGRLPTSIRAALGDLALALSEAADHHPCLMTRAGCLGRGAASSCPDVMSEPRPRQQESDTTLSRSP
jgi:hypothetical protein